MKSFKELVLNTHNVLNESKVDKVNSKLCRLLNTCSLNHTIKEGTYEVCPGNIDNRYRSQDGFQNELDAVVTSSMNITGGDQDTIKGEDIKNYRHILKLPDEEFVKVYVDVLQKAHINYKSFYDNLSKYKIIDVNLYNTFHVRMNRLLEVFKTVVREKDGYSNCEFFNIILENDKFMKIVHSSERLAEIK